MSVRFGATRAVDAVDLDVAPGEILALLGPSGSGKSSLLRGIAGLEPLAGGSVAWDGLDVTAMPVHRRGFGVMFQDGQLFPHRDVAGNVAYGLDRMPRPARRARVEELLALVGLDGLATRPVHALSGGQAQRVALARALAPRPRLLLLDEPLSALDRSLREHLVSVLLETLRVTGTTAVHVTHDQDEAFALGDRVAVMDDGRIAQVDTPQRLWRNPVDKDVAAFLGYGPFLSPAEAARFGITVTPGAMLGLGPVALAPDPAGTPARVLDQVDHRGGVRVRVELPGGTPAWVRTRGRVTGATLPVVLDPAECVSVPGDGR